MNVFVGTKQFKMVLDEEFVERLRTVANKTGRDSAQHLAEEVLAVYLPVYVAVFEATRRAIDYQTGVATGAPLRKREQDANEIINGITVAPNVRSLWRDWEGKVAHNPTRGFVVESIFIKVEDYTDRVALLKAIYEEMGYEMPAEYEQKMRDYLNEEVLYDESDVAWHYPMG